MPDRAARRAVLVGCSHGTDNLEGRAVVAGILDDVRAARPDLDVRDAFVDVQEPEVGDVVREALTAGQVVVVPLLLSAGFHVHVDIAEAVSDPHAAASGALGPDDRLVEVLVERLVEAGAGAGDAVVLAAAGSSDRRAVDAVEEVASALTARWPHGPVTVGYGSAASPTVPQAVVAARDAGAARVVLAAYLLAPGFFHDRLMAAGADVVTAPLAPHRHLAAIVLDRFADAAAQLERNQAASSSAQ